MKYNIINEPIGNPRDQKDDTERETLQRIESVYESIIDNKSISQIDRCRGAKQIELIEIH